MLHTGVECKWLQFLFDLNELQGPFQLTDETAISGAHFLSAVLNEFFLQIAVSNDGILILVLLGVLLAEEGRLVPVDGA